MNNLLVLIRRAIKQARTYIIVKNHLKYKSYLQVIVSSGVIFSYTVIGDYILIKFKYSLFDRGFECLKVGRFNRELTLKFQNLNRLNWRGSLDDIMLTTDRGVIILKGSVSRHVGGKPLLKLKWL